MTDHKQESLAREMVNTINRSDWEALRAVLAPGLVTEEVGTRGRHEGPDEFIAAVQAWKSSFPDIAGEIRRIVTDGGTVVMQLTWRGTQTGPLPLGPGRELPATGTSAEMEATMWQQWEGGRLVSERHYLDMLGLLTQLGAIPG